MNKKSQQEWDMGKVSVFLIFIVAALAFGIYLVLVFVPITPGVDIDFITAASNQYLESRGLGCEAIDISSTRAWYICNDRPYYMSFTGDPTVKIYYDNRAFNITDSGIGFDYIEDLDEGYKYYKSERNGDYVGLYFYNLDQGKFYNFSLTTMKVISSSSYDFVSELQSDFNRIYNSDCVVDVVWELDFHGSQLTHFNITCGNKTAVSAIFDLRLHPPFFSSGGLADRMRKSFEFTFQECGILEVSETKGTVEGRCNGFDIRMRYTDASVDETSSFIEFDPRTLNVEGTINYIMDNPKYLFSQQDLSTTDFTLSETLELDTNCTAYIYEPFTLYIRVCGYEIRGVSLCANGFC